MGFDSSPRVPRWLLRAALCVFTSSQWVNTVNIIRHHGHHLQTNLSTKLTEHWGQDVTVCRVCGPTVVWLPVYSVRDHWRNCVLQLPEQQHSDNRFTHTCWAFVCGWNDSYPPSGCSQSFRPPEATNFGLDWLWLCCRPPWLVEALSWRRKLCCDWPLLVTPEQVICININTPNFGGLLIFNWCKFCVCNITCVCLFLCV